MTPPDYDVLVAGAGPAGVADLGVGYGRDRGSAVLLAAATGAPAPHVPVRHRDRQMSTLVLFDGRFTLRTGPAGAGWRAAADAPPSAFR